MRNRFDVRPWILFSVVVILDQVSKTIVQRSMNIRESIQVLGSVIKFTYIHNPGGAFGLSIGGSMVYVVFSVFATIFIIFYLISLPVEKRWLKNSLALVLGGAVGNLIDRFRFMEVIDFIDIGIGHTRWPVFNVADIGITVGVVSLMFIMLIKKEL